MYQDVIMMHTLLMAIYQSYPAVAILAVLVVIIIRKLKAENAEQAQRDAYVDRVYREKCFEEKFDQIRRNRSERSEDWQ